MMPVMKPLHILSVANVHEDPNAGAAGAEFQTIQALRSLGHDVDDVWADSIERRIAHGNLHYLLELPRRYEQIVAERLGRIAYDVVHVNQPHGYRAARLVQKRWPKVALVHRSHGFEPRVAEIVKHWRRIYGEESASPWRRAASAAMAALVGRHNRAITRWADGHLLCSTQDADYMVERFQVARSRIAVVPHAAPNDYIETPPPAMTAERLRRVLYVGQFAFVKAPMVVAAAMSGIVAKREDAELTWVAARRDHPAIRALLSPAARARVTLLDWMPQSSLRDVYDRAGIFLFPSFFEGTGKASIEALSRGMCVLTSDVGGMHDMIVPDQSGLLLPPGNAAAVAKAALELLSDLPRAQRLASGGSLRARQFTWKRTAEETASFYRQRLEAKR
jgi:glycosyltransferase involved in cell wall biosynthesis